MTSKTFVSGTVIDSAWLNDVNGAAYLGSAVHTPSGAGALPTTMQQQFRDIQARTVNVMDAPFYAKGDGTTDDTAAFAAAMTYCAANFLALYVPTTAASYKVSAVRVLNGVRAFYSNGAKLLGISSVTEGVIEMDGPYFGSSAVENCLVFGFTINGNLLARRGIFAAGAQSCKIFNNTIVSMSTTLSESGINLHHLSAGNQVYANHITHPTPGSGKYFTGIALMSNTVDDYGGWMDGSIVQPTDICNRNLISGNYIYGGSHGIGLFGAQNNVIVGNICQGGRDRGIIMSPVASYNLVNGNQCIDFGSSGIHMAYGSVNNVVTGNTVRSYTATGEGGIQAYIGCSENKIADNRISCTSHYGVYLAIDAYGNEVSNNQITGVSRAGVAIESDWAAVNPALAIYSRPNYSAPVAPRVNWYNGGSFGNKVSDNSFDTLGSGVCAIYVAQLGSGAYNQENVFYGNVVKLSAPAHYMYVFEESSGKSFGHTLKNNVFKAFDITKVYATRGRAHFTLLEGNSIYNDQENFVQIASGTATPSVAECDNISTAVYAAPTNVTNFTGGKDGQIITVRMSVNTTIVHNTSFIRLKGGVNAGGGAVGSNDFIVLRNLLGVWIEMSRTF